MNWYVNNIFIFILFIPVIAFSSEQSDIIELSKQSYLSALKQYDSQIAYCKGLSDSNKITNGNKKILQSLKLTDKQFKKTLFILQWIQSDNCINDRLGLFLISKGQYKSTLKHYNKVDDDIYSDDDLFMTAQTFYEYKITYLNLPFKVREKIESVEQLKKPFHFSLSYTLKE